MAANENLPPNVIKQLAKEFKTLDESPPEGIKVVVNDDDFSTIYADIDGPDSTQESMQNQIPNSKVELYLSPRLR